MPFYNYKCNSCGDVFEIFHLMSEECEVCSCCGEYGDIERIPSELLNARKVENKKVGDLVKRHIEEAKLEISQEKKNLKGGTYK